MMNNSIPLFDFNGGSSLSNWYVVDDVVMGGRSDGRFELNNDGHGVFCGEVSLANNGGFSSVRYRFDKKDINGIQYCKIRLKGDGKRYQFRVKNDARDAHVYIHYFETSGSWEVISIPLAEMHPSYRGRWLRRPNYTAQELSEIAFLIGNKQNEFFCLQLDWITLE